MKTLVELCAGSAAVSLRWLRAGAVPPIGYLGGKRAFADAILGALGLAPGGGRGERVVLVEPGPWGEAWAAWRTDEGRKGTIDQLRAWGDRDPRDLAAAPVPSDLAARVATWAALQFWSFGRKPVVARLDGDGLSTSWRTHGFDRAGAYRSTLAAERRAAGDDDYAIGRDQRLPILIDRLQRLPRLDGVEVECVDARTVPPVPGAVALIDPDYEGTTGYGFTLPRPDVLEVARRWSDAGAAVAVCEAEPLPLDGWHQHRLPPPFGRGRTFSAQRDEWLTMNFPPAGQLAMMLAGAR